jgi:hypothetical protein
VARIRSIKPEFWDDRKLARLARRDARLLYIGLWNLADEWGRLNGDPQWIKGQIYPYDDDIDADYVSKLLAELENPQLSAVMAYEASGDPYLYLPKLGRHQRLEPEKVKSRLPGPPGDPDPDDPDPLPAGSVNGADSSAHGADQSAQDANLAARGAERGALLYVAGSMEQGAGSRGARGRARDADAAPCELPEDFAPSEAMLKWAERKYPGLDLDFETGQFIYHYRAHGDRRKSWPDQWQKWLGDSWQRRKLSRGSAPTGMATSDARVVAGLGLAAAYAEEEQAGQRKELLP